MNMWDHGTEINKVCMNFLRQILGVHKKTSNIALMTETGKYPTIMKVFLHIYKYWQRLESSTNTFLTEAHKMNVQNYAKGQTNWYKIIDFFQKLTNNKTEDTNKARHLFKESMDIMFNLWWEDESKREGSKLDFYFSIKKSFGFENYLDKIPYSARRALTKLRLSCHCLPVEVLRYNKKKVERKDRTCNICTMNKIGDEKHYLKECQNKGLVDIRQKFMPPNDNFF